MLMGQTKEDRKIQYAIIVFINHGQTKSQNIVWTSSRIYINIILRLTLRWGHLSCGNSCAVVYSLGNKNNFRKRRGTTITQQERISLYMKISAHVDHRKLSTKTQIISLSSIHNPQITLRSKVYTGIYVWNMYFSVSTALFYTTIVIENVRLGCMRPVGHRLDCSLGLSI